MAFRPKAQVEWAVDTMKDTLEVVFGDLSSVYTSEHLDDTALVVIGEALRKVESFRRLVNSIDRELKEGILEKNEQLTEEVESLKGQLLAYSRIWEGLDSLPAKLGGVLAHNLKENREELGRIVNAQVGGFNSQTEAVDKLLALVSDQVQNLALGEYIRHTPKRPRNGASAPNYNTAINDEEIARRYKEGERIQAIADSYGVWYQTIQKRLKAAGVELVDRRKGSK